MSGLLITDVRLALPIGPVEGWLRTDGTRIAALGRGEPPAAPDGVRTVPGAGGTLMPGFVDVHVHGGAGCDVMDADEASLRTMARFFARHGVTSYLATTATAGDEQTRAALATVRAVLDAPREPDGARLLGVHLEGPYINPERAGAHDARHVRAVTRAEASAYLDSGVVRIVTLAPEIDGGWWLVDECARRGVAASAGHTSATYDEIVEASVRGLRHVTHTFNAMRSLHHREPGTLGAALALSELRAELIADTVHVHPAAMRLMLELRGLDGVVLVSDAAAAAGLGDGVHPFHGREVTVADGAVRLPDGTLAGSVLTMDRAVRNVAALVDREPARLWRAASANAAVSAGVADRKGTLAPGLDADLVLLDGDAEVALTVVEGTIAYERSQTPAPAAELAR